MNNKKIIHNYIRKTKRESIYLFLALLAVTIIAPMIFTNTALSSFSLIILSLLGIGYSIFETDNDKTDSKKMTKGLINSWHAFCKERFHSRITSFTMIIIMNLGMGLYFFNINIAKYSIDDGAFYNQSGKESIAFPNKTFIDIPLYTVVNKVKCHLYQKDFEVAEFCLLNIKDHNIYFKNNETTNIKLIKEFKGYKKINKEVGFKKKHIMTFLFLFFNGILLVLFHALNFIFDLTKIKI